MKYRLPLLIIFVVTNFTIIAGITLFSLPRETKKEIITAVEKKSYYIVDEGGVPAIYLKEEISGPDEYRELIAYINSHKNTAHLKLYISGDGGSVRSLLDIYNTLQTTSTQVHVIVYGDVYSAHAVLAFSGKDLKVLNPNTVFLFHVPAVIVDGEAVKTPDSCSAISETSKDRGISLREKCYEYFKKTNLEVDSIFNTKIKPFLTDKQVADYYAGHDILVSAQDLYNRGLPH